MLFFHPVGSSLLNSIFSLKNQFKGQWVKSALTLALIFIFTSSILGPSVPFLTSISKQSSLKDGLLFTSLSIPLKCDHFKDEDHDLLIFTCPTPHKVASKYITYCHISKPNARVTKYRFKIPCPTTFPSEHASMERPACFGPWSFDWLCKIKIYSHRKKIFLNSSLTHSPYSCPRDQEITTVKYHNERKMLLLSEQSSFFPIWILTAKSSCVFWCFQFEFVLQFWLPADYRYNDSFGAQEKVKPHILGVSKEPCLQESSAEKQ